MLTRTNLTHFFAITALLFILLINTPLLISIFNEWNSNGPYSHGLLGIVVVAYVFYLLSRHWVVKALSVTHYLMALFCLLASYSVLLIAQFSSIQQLQQLALFSLSVSLLFCFYGWTTLKHFFMPLFMLLLILPVWNVAQFPLREVSTFIGKWGPELIGIGVEREGYRLTTTGGMFDVEPACSGLGFFLVAALFAFCVGFFNKLSIKKALTFLLISLAFSLVANWIRITIIIVVGTYTEMNHFIVKDHLTFGWIVFAMCLLPLIYIAREYFDNNQKQEPNIKPETTSTLNKLQALTTILVLVVFISLSYWVPSRYDENYALPVPKLENYQLVSAGKAYSPNWNPYSQGATQERFFYYLKNEHAVQVYVADYVKQQQANEMIYVDNYLFDKQFWHKSSERKLLLNNSTILPNVNLVIVQKMQGRYRMIASWYAINNTLTSDKKRAKLAEVQATIQGKPGATLIAVALDYNEQDQLLAETQLSDFIHSYINPSL